MASDNPPPAAAICPVSPPAVELESVPLILDIEVPDAPAAVSEFRDFLQPLVRNPDSGPVDDRGIMGQLPNQECCMISSQVRPGVLGCLPGGGRPANTRLRVALRPGPTEIGWIDLDLVPNSASRAPLRPRRSPDRKPGTLAVAGHEELFVAEPDNGVRSSLMPS